MDNLRQIPLLSETEITKILGFLVLRLVSLCQNLSLADAVEPERYISQ